MTIALAEEDRYLVPIPTLTKRLHERSHQNLVDPLFTEYALEASQQAADEESYSFKYAEQGILYFVTGPRYSALAQACFTAIVGGVKEIIDTKMGCAISLDSTLQP